MNSIEQSVQKDFTSLSQHSGGIQAIKPKHDLSKSSKLLVRLIIDIEVSVVSLLFRVRFLIQWFLESIFDQRLGISDGHGGG